MIRFLPYTGVVLLTLACNAITLSSPLEEDYVKARALLRTAQSAMNEGKYDSALQSATQATQIAPSLSAAHMLRGLIHDKLHKYSDAESDQTNAIKLEPKSVDAYQWRGEARFKQGKIKQSIEDFDKVIELAPAREPYHWQRGISYYYAGRYKDGVRQFDIHQTVNSADVENAVWRFICQAKLIGFDKAQKDILKIGEDHRVPMRQIYDLFAGKVKPEDVIEAAQAGEPNAAQLKNRLFYAHQYLGLYYESKGQADLARKHTRLAAEKYNMGHYMWQVANVHWQRMNKKSGEK